MNKPGGGWEGHDAGVSRELLREVLQDLEGPVAGSGASSSGLPLDISSEAIADHPFLAAFTTTPHADPLPMPLHTLPGAFRCVSCHEPLCVDPVLAYCNNDDDEPREFSKIWALTECGHLLDSACVSAYLCHPKRVVRSLIPPSKRLWDRAHAERPSPSAMVFSCPVPSCDTTFRTIQVGTATRPRWTFSRDASGQRPQLMPYGHYWCDPRGYATLEDLDRAGARFDVAVRGWEDPMRWRFRKMVPLTKEYS